MGKGKGSTSKRFSCVEISSWDEMGRGRGGCRSPGGRVTQAEENPIGAVGVGENQFPV